MFKKAVTYAGATAGLAAALVLGSGAAAFAHECFNTNRSEQGNASAGSHSEAWFTLVVAEVVQEGVGPEGYTQADADCILDAYAATGAPTSFTMLGKGAVGQDGTIGGNNPNESHAADGKGIDHLFAAYGAEIVGSYAACGVEF